MHDDKFEHFSFLDLFTEADDDDTTEGGGGENNTSDNDDTTTDNGDTDSNDDNADDGDDNGNDEFDIDTSVDDDGDDSDTSSDDSGSSSTSGGGDTSSMGDNDSEANPINTSLFDSLTPEEQAIKIKELKKLYRDLFTSLNDLLARIEVSDAEEDTLDYTNRLTNDLYDLKNAVMDYFVYQFDQKSYPENDMKFNEFLYYLNSLKDIYEELASSKDEKLGNKDTKG